MTTRQLVGGLITIGMIVLSYTAMYIGNALFVGVSMIGITVGLTVIFYKGDK